MDTDYIARLYDDAYASTYDAKFLEAPSLHADALHELTLLEELLADGRSWLDVACGTGWFLSRFETNERAGMDVSPAMLRKARLANPRIPLLLHDFTKPLPAYEGRFGLVSCMWYAYGLVDTIDDAVRVIHNLWSWAASDGACFVPLADPELIAGATLRRWYPYGAADRVELDALVWSFVESDGKTHRHQIAPLVPFMTESFEAYFEEVEVVRYPPVVEGEPGRPAIMARGKKRLRET